jgi:hypothetical protein
MADTEDLEALSSKELHDRALARAREHGDVRFLWRLLREIPAAEAAAGDMEGNANDLLHVSSLIADFTHSGEGEIADALRPVYIDYLSSHR